jgi:rhodanese-related sulfurtransferase
MPPTDAPIRVTWRAPCVRAQPTAAVVAASHEGYTSSLAAAVLRDLGLHRATDLIGGFKAWSRAGLPVYTADSGR